MNSNRNLWVALVAVAIIAIGGYLFPQIKSKFGSVSTNCSGFTTCFSDLYSTTQFGGTGSIQADGTLTSLGALFLGGSLFQGGLTAATAAVSTTTVVTCNAGIYAASSTQFSVANPLSATSTVFVDSLNVVGQATSSSLYMGTTSQATGVLATTIGTSLLNNALLATSTQATYVPGQTTALGSGQVSPGTGTFSHVVVGPSERVTLFATSTYTGAGNLNYTAGVGCTARLKWTN